MSRQLLRTISQFVARKNLSTSAVFRTSAVLDQEAKDRIHPRIGNRDVVGYGINGSASYFDIEEIPFPAIRFKESVGENLALMEKQKNDWKTLTLEEKKSLYRISFCQTFAEINAPTGEWKRVMSVFLLGCTITGWIIILMKLYVYPAPPLSINAEWQKACLQRMIDQRAGAVEGTSSNYDYEKGRWKD